MIQLLPSASHCLQLTICLQQRCPGHNIIKCNMHQKTLHGSIINALAQESLLHWSTFSMDKIIRSTIDFSTFNLSLINLIMSLKQDDVVTASTYILIKKAAWFERMAVHFCANGVVDHNPTLT
jgi:hypothetical protein